MSFGPLTFFCLHTPLLTILKQSIMIVSQFYIIFKAVKYQETAGISVEKRSSTVCTIRSKYMIFI